MRKKLFSLILILVAAAGMAFAQNKVQLNIQCDQTGAKIYLNDNAVGYTTPNFSMSIFPGTYTVRIVKDGFAEFRTSFTAYQSPITIVAHLAGSPQTPPPPPAPSPSNPGIPVLPVPPQPHEPSYQFNVRANVNGAQVYINGSYVGSTPLAIMLPRGNYSVVVRLDGYQDYSRSIRLNGPYTLVASLNSYQYSVSISAINAPNATIYRDNSYVGSSPYRGTWSYGSYMVRISAPGFADYAQQVFVNGPVNLQVSLTPLAVDYEIKLPDDLYSSWKRLGKFSDVDVYFDDAKIDSLRGKAVPGTHHITLKYRDLRLESDFVLPAGKPVTIELSLGVTVY